MGAASRPLAERMGSDGYTTLEQLEEHYPGGEDPMGALNYVWFQYQWMRLAAEMFSADGEGGLVRFWNCFPTVSGSMAPLTPQQFPERFAAGWSLPKPEPFLDYFLPLVAHDACSRQPLAADARGHAEIGDMFRRLFALLPDMVATPQHWAISGEMVFIESACAGTLGGRPFWFLVSDRFELSGGQIAARLSTFDCAAMVLALWARPRAWGGRPASARSRRRRRLRQIRAQSV